MSRNFDVEEIKAVLRDCPEYEAGHHLERPYMSAYQIAIRFAERYPATVEQLGLKVGGEGTGEYTSLAQQLARFLSGELKAGRGGGIEGVFISHDRVKEHAFDSGANGDVRVSTLKSEQAHAIFRFIG